MEGTLERERTRAQELEGELLAARQAVQRAEGLVEGRGREACGPTTWEEVRRVIGMASSA